MTDNPAEFLRETATLMRQRARAATNGVPFEYVSGAVRHISRNVETETFVDEDALTERYGDSWAGWDRYNDANHIWSWSPAVALAVASYLDEVARQEDFRKHGAGPDLRFRDGALAIARAYRRLP